MKHCASCTTPKVKDNPPCESCRHYWQPLGPGKGKLILEVFIFPAKHCAWQVYVHPSMEGNSSKLSQNVGRKTGCSCMIMPWHNAHCMWKNKSPNIASWWSQPTTLYPSQTLQFSPLQMKDQLKGCHHKDATKVQVTSKIVLQKVTYGSPYRNILNNCQNTGQYSEGKCI